MIVCCRTCEKAQGWRAKYGGRLKDLHCQHCGARGLRKLTDAERGARADGQHMARLFETGHCYLDGEYRVTVRKVLAEQRAARPEVYAPDLFEENDKQGWPCVTLSHVLGDLVEHLPEIHPVRLPRILQGVQERIRVMLNSTRDFIGGQVVQAMSMPAPIQALMAWLENEGLPGTKHGSAVAFNGKDRAECASLMRAVQDYYNPPQPEPVLEEMAALARGPRGIDIPTEAQRRGIPNPVPVKDAGTDARPGIVNGQGATSGPRERLTPNIKSGLEGGGK